MPTYSEQTRRALANQRRALSQPDEHDVDFQRPACWCAYLASLQDLFLKHLYAHLAILTTFLSTKGLIAIANSLAITKSTVSLYLFVAGAILLPILITVVATKLYQMRNNKYNENAALMFSYYGSMLGTSLGYELSGIRCLQAAVAYSAHHIAPAFLQFIGASPQHTALLSTTATSAKVALASMGAFAGIWAALGTYCVKQIYKNGYKKIAYAVGAQNIIGALTFITFAGTPLGLFIMAVTLSTTLVSLSVTNQLKHDGNTIATAYLGLGVLAADIGAVLIPLLLAGTLATPTGAVMVATMLLVNFLYALAAPHVLFVKTQPVLPARQRTVSPPLQSSGVFLRTSEIEETNPEFSVLLVATEEVKAEHKKTLTSTWQ